jgi:hypothetical protein
MLVSAFVAAKELGMRVKSEAVDQEMPPLEITPDDVMSQLRGQFVSGDGFNHKYATALQHSQAHRHIS